MELCGEMGFSAMKGVARTGMDYGAKRSKKPSWGFCNSHFRYNESDIGILVCNFRDQEILVGCNETDLTPGRTTVHQKFDGE